MIKMTGAKHTKSSSMCFVYKPLGIKRRAANKSPNEWLHYWIKLRIDINNSAQHV